MNWHLINKRQAYHLLNLTTNYRPISILSRFNKVKQTLLGETDCVFYVFNYVVNRMQLYCYNLVIEHFWKTLITSRCKKIYVYLRKMYCV